MISVFDRVENIMGKEKILFIRICSFSYNSLLSQGHFKSGLCGNELKQDCLDQSGKKKLNLNKSFTTQAFTTQSKRQVMKTLKKTAFKNILAKGENAGKFCCLVKS